MKFIVLFLGSTTLVAGGTAITSQQDVRNNVITNQRPHQESRAISHGTDCPSVETPIFGNVAHPLVVGNPDCGLTTQWGFSPFTDVDIDGDNISESSSGLYEKQYFDPECSQFQTFNEPSRKISVNFDTNPSALVLESYLELSPEFMQYDGLDLLNYPWGMLIRHVGNIDVTNDGKPDAIIDVRISLDCMYTEELVHFFYVENILEWPAACASDLNSDGSVEVNDLMQIISDWGACP